jgi:predicted nucleic acid-binding protein
MLNNLVCLDASFLVRLVTSHNDTRPKAMVESWLDQRRQLIAPTLLYYEVCNALYLYQRVGQLESEAVQKALTAAMAVPVQLHGGPELHRSALNYASQYGLKATYDAHYLVLAERMGSDLWTADRRLARTVQSMLSWVHLLE